MQQHKLGYASYLVRTWQEHVNGRLVWRASLHSTATGEVRAFSSLADLLAYLDTQHMDELPRPLGY